MRSSKRLAVAVVAFGLFAVAPVAEHSTYAQSNRAAKAALSRRMPSVALKNIPLGDAIEHVRDLSQVNIVVNWRALTEAGVTRDTPVNVSLHDVSLNKILATILGEAGAGSALTFTTEENVIEITTLALADQQMFTRIYPIEDLIMDIPNFDNAPDFNLTSNTGSGGGSGGGGGKNGGGGGGGMGGSIFGGGGNTKTDEKAKTKDERAKDLVDLIQNTIRPDSSRKNGGQCSIRYFNGNLIVTAPASIHELIGG